MVDKDAGQLIADCLGEQFCNNRAVNASGQCQQNLAVADLFTNLIDGGVAVVLHAPVADCAAHIIKEVAQHLAAVLGVLYLWMILEAKDLLSRFCIAATGQWSVCAMLSKPSGSLPT